MTVLAHVVPEETSLVDRLVHPFTGLDHVVAIVLVALALLLTAIAWRGRAAATTAGTTTRVRTVGSMVLATVLLVASILVLVSV